MTHEYKIICMDSPPKRVFDIFNNFENMYYIFFQLINSYYCTCFKNKFSLGYQYVGIIVTFAGFSKLSL